MKKLSPVSMRLNPANTPPPVDARTNLPGASPFKNEADSLAALTVGQGLKVQLFASEAEFPELVQVAIDAMVIPDVLPFWRAVLGTKKIVLQANRDYDTERLSRPFEIRPGIVIPPGVRHRAVGRMKVLIVVLPKFDAGTAVAEIATYRCTSTFMAPTLLKRLVDLPADERARYDVSSMRVIVVAAAPCPMAVKEGIIAWFGPVLYEFYGSTELGINTILPPEDALPKPGSSGRPAPGSEIAILDDTGQPVPRGTAGELFVRRRPEMFQDELSELPGSVGALLQSGKVDQRQLAAVVTQKDHRRERAEQASHVDKLDRTAAGHQCGVGEADGGCSSSQKKKDAGQPYLFVEDRQTGTAELCAPVAEAREEGERHHGQGEEGDEECASSHRGLPGKEWRHSPQPTRPSQRRPGRNRRRSVPGALPGEHVLADFRLQLGLRQVLPFAEGLLQVHDDDRLDDRDEPDDTGAGDPLRPAETQDEGALRVLEDAHGPPRQEREDDDDDHDEDDHEDDHEEDDVTPPVPPPPLLNVPVLEASPL